MPDYSYEKTFTAGTSADEQEELEMPCHWGILTACTIAFPAGCHGVVNVHVDEVLHQIFPTNPDGTYALDDFTHPISCRYTLLPDTRKLYLRGWNEGTYDHTIRVTFHVELADQYTKAELVLLHILELLERLFGRRRSKK